MSRVTCISSMETRWSFGLVHISPVASSLLRNLCPSSDFLNVVQSIQPLLLFHANPKPLTAASRLQQLMYNTICSYPLSSDLFSLAIHPKKPFLAVGLASGHVQLNQLPPPTGSASLSSTIDTAWRTRRHKGSCRSLCFSGDGEVIFSAGTDGLVKAAKTDSGVVEAKIAVPLHKYARPHLLHWQTKQSIAHH